MKKDKTIDKKPDGIRIQLKGLRTSRELLVMLHDAVDQLEGLGVKHIRGANLYITPVDQDGNPLTRFRGWRKMPAITIREPYRSAAEDHGL